MRLLCLLLLVLGLLATLCGSAQAAESRWKTLSGHPTVLLGHRGDPFWAPDHSLASYTIAIEEQLDYIEPDLQLSKDGVVFCSHDPFLSRETNVAERPEFATRKRRIKIDEGPVIDREDWWFVDFTAEELKTLVLRQPEPDPKKRNQVFNDLFHLNTFEEFLDFIRTMSGNVNRTLGIVPEIKHSSFYKRDSVDKGRSETYFEDLVLQQLSEFGYDIQGDYKNPERGHYLIPSTWQGYPGPVMLQSFEVDNLIYLNSTTTIPLVQLVDLSRNEQIYDPEGRAFVASYAEAVSAPHFHYLENEHLFKDIHESGLGVVAFTLRNEREDPYIDIRFGGSYRAMFEYFFARGADALFVEKSYVGLAAREIFGSSPGTQPAPDPPADKYKTATAFLVCVLVALVFAYAYLFYRQQKLKHTVESMGLLNNGDYAEYINSGGNLEV